MVKTLYSESTGKNSTSFIQIFIVLVCKKKKSYLFFKLSISFVFERFCNVTSFKDCGPMKSISTLEQMIMRCVLSFEIGFQIKHSQFCSKKDTDNLRT